MNNNRTQNTKKRPKTFTKSRSCKYPGSYLLKSHLVKLNYALYQARNINERIIWLTVWRRQVYPICPCWRETKDFVLLKFAVWSSFVFEQILLSGNHAEGCSANTSKTHQAMKCHSQATAGSFHLETCHNLFSLKKQKRATPSMSPDVTHQRNHACFPVIKWFWDSYVNPPLGARFIQIRLQSINTE